MKINEKRKWRHMMLERRQDAIREWCSLKLMNISQEIIINNNIETQVMM